MILHVLYCIQNNCAILWKLWFCNSECEKKEKMQVAKNVWCTRLDVRVEVQTEKKGREWGGHVWRTCNPGIICYVECAWRERLFTDFNPQHGRCCIIISKGMFPRDQLLSWYYMCALERSYQLSSGLLLSLSSEH